MQRILARRAILPDGRQLAMVLVTQTDPAHYLVEPFRRETAATSYTSEPLVLPADAEIEIKTDDTAEKLLIL